MPMKSPKKVLMFGALAAVATPPLIFLLVALSSGLGPGAAAEALWLQVLSGKLNLLVCGLLGLVPVCLVAVVLWIAKKRGAEDSLRMALVCGGLIPILSVLIWANLEYWPRFLPSRTYPGFPNGLELVIGPGMFAPIGAAAGMFIAWVITRVIK